ncbi:MAG: ferritin family protein [Thermoanaerobaculia bacterium]
MELSEIIKTAMQGEMDGYYHYSNAAISTEDEKAKEIFQGLAEEEKKHYKILSEWLQFTQKEITSFDYNKIKEVEKLKFSGESPIFSEEFKKKIREKHLEMSALSIGMLLEKTSIDFYRNWAEKVEEKEAKEFLEELAKWEEGHLEALNKQKRFFTESLWSNAHFEPF